MEKDEFEKLIKESYTIGQFRKALGLPCNGCSRKKVISIIEKHSLDTSHFDKGKSRRKYEREERECPVCKGIFEIKKNTRGEKQITCSRSCANSYFRIHAGNGNYDNLKSYKKICYRHHERKCVCCKEDKILDVHHYDGDRNNNSPENLIPLCPTHHRYVHSKYKNEIIDKINSYIKKWKSNQFNSLTFDE